MWDGLNTESPFIASVTGPTPPTIRSLTGALHISFRSPTIVPTNSKLVDNKLVKLVPLQKQRMGSGSWILGLILLPPPGEYELGMAIGIQKRSGTRIFKFGFGTFS